MSTRIWTVESVFDTKDSESNTEIPTCIHVLGILQAEQWLILMR